MGRRCGCRFASPFCLCWQEGMDYFIEASTLLRYLRAHEWDVDKATATSGPNDRTLLIPFKEVLIMSDTCKQWPASLCVSCTGLVPWFLYTNYMHALMQAAAAVCATARWRKEIADGEWDGAA